MHFEGWLTLLGRFCCQGAVLVAEWETKGTDDKLTRSSYVIRNSCLADAELIPPTCSVLQTATSHSHAWRVVRDRRGKEETRGMGRPFF